MASVHYDGERTVSHGKSVGRGLRVAGEGEIVEDFRPGEHDEPRAGWASLCDIRLLLLHRTCFISITILISAQRPPFLPHSLQH